jgi:arsenate reductase
MNMLGKGKFEAESAGLKPTGIMPEVVRVMLEEGVDLSGKQTNNVFEFYRKGRLFDVVITVCNEAEEAECPIFPGVAQRLSLPFPDPKSFEGTDEERLEKVRDLRDRIRESVEEFMEWYKSSRTDRLSSRWKVVS